MNTYYRSFSDVMVIRRFEPAFLTYGDEDVRLRVGVGAMW